MSRKELEDLCSKKSNSLLKKENNTIVDSIIKDVRNLFRLKKEKKAIKDRAIRDVRTLLGPDKEDYHKPTTCRCF